MQSTRPKEASGRWPVKLIFMPAKHMAGAANPRRSALASISPLIHVAPVSVHADTDIYTTLLFASSLAYRIYTDAGGLLLTRPSGLRLDQAFRAAGDTAAFASLPHPSSLKAMRLLMLLDNAYLLFSTTFNRLCVGAALVWLTYRAWLVIHKPLEELVGLLGCEIPQHPHVDLAGIKADGFVLHWKAVDDRKSMHRYEIQLNGSIVGQISHANTSFAISNLRPNQLYIVRVITVNAVEFRAASSPIRLCTKSADSQDFFDPSWSTESASSGPVIRPLHVFQPDTPAIPATPPPLVRETSNGPLQAKKSLFGRRPSPLPGLDTQLSSFDEANDEDGSGDNQQALTEKLDEIGRETAEVDRQIQEEEQEAIAAKASLVKERDELRGELKEKDDTSRDLRKQVNALERNNQAAQNKKNAQEKALQQKQSERQKLKDDAARWQKEMAQITEDMGSIEEQKQTLLQDTEREKVELLEKHAQELQTLRSMEDENKEVGAQIKKLEREMTDSPSGSEPNEHNDALAAIEAEEDRQWAERLRRLEEQYVIAHQNMDAARRYFETAISQLSLVKQRQSEITHMASAIPPIFDQPISRASSLRQRRPPSGPSANNSNGSPFAPSTAPAFSSALATSGPTTIPPGFTTSASSFFNFNNGMTLDRPLDDFSPAEIDKLTGGAPMSPSAGAELLPAGLLSNADEDFLPPAVLPGLGAGLGASRPFDQLQGPTSPGSVGSNSPSLLASPRASANNLIFHSPETGMDSDRRSIRSNRSARAASGSAPHTGASRFGQILGLDKLNRQRGKTLSEEGPALGSLSKSQSQSLPRNDEADELAGSGRRRNSSHSGNFFGLNLGRTTGHTKSMGAESLPTQKHIAVRRRPFNMFGAKTDGWAAILGQDRAAALNERSNVLSNLGKDDGRSSPRPISVHSNELPRPSQDSSSWGLWSSNEPYNQRSSPLSSDWMAAPAVPHNMWNSSSRQTSRRPSIQHGQSGGSLSYDMLDDMDNNSSYAFSPPQSTASLAPIGTKPAHMLKRNIPDPKLNPAAKDFRSLFSRPSSISSDAEDEEDDRINLIRATPITSPFKAPHQPLPLDLDPPSSPEIGRESRDAQSINTASSILSDSRDSLDRSISYTASDSAPSTSITSNKGSSLMSKLTRKHSSGKFQFPTFTRSTTERSKRESQLLDVEDEESMSKSMESEKGKGSVRSWSSMFGVGKKKDKVPQTPKEETPSLSGASLASTEHGEDDH
ncbi:hypothetical protein E4T38_08901 [Aureobasidium subglaciale]|nr:hypothetical protein E4T38_08901 [Aureobasidium subglaciale]KAI5217583.1 hypothetical protein E4T41_08768 [Aureobasidium subglaciale]